MAFEIYYVVWITNEARKWARASVTYAQCALHSSVCQLQRKFFRFILSSCFSIFFRSFICTTCRFLSCRYAFETRSSVRALLSRWKKLFNQFDAPSLYVIEITSRILKYFNFFSSLASWKPFAYIANELGTNIIFFDHFPQRVRWMKCMRELLPLSKTQSNSMATPTRLLLKHQITPNQNKALDFSTVKFEITLG